MEIWKTIKDFEALYEVSNYGAVRSKKKTLKPRTHTRGYLRVYLTAKHERYVHRLVAEAFIENPDSLPQVNHKDGNKQNNRVDNLEWTSGLENMRHAQAAGLFEDAGKKQSAKIRGENHPCAKLNEENVLQIRRFHSQGVGPSSLARQFGVSLGAIEKIVYRQAWKHI